MNLEDLFDRLQELFEESWRMPLSNGKAVVDVLEATELVRELRSNLPVELEQARRIVEERKEIVTTARREAEVMLKNAEEKAKFMTSREEIVAAANREANEILLEAKRQASDVLKQATEQATEMGSSEDAMMVDRPGGRCLHPTPKSSMGRANPKGPSTRPNQPMPWRSTHEVR